jgi:hypothetical protein
MTRDTAHSCLAVVLLVLAAGCKREVHYHTTNKPPVVVEETPRPCAALEAACPPMRLVCTTDQGACVNTLRGDFADFCSIAMGDPPCVDGKVTDEFRHYCEVDGCFGGNLDECLAAGLTACPPSCGPVDDVQKDCDGWASSPQHHACTSYSSDENTCIADILSDLRNNGQNCFDWTRPTVICLAGHISVEGYAACAIEECLGLNTTDSCAQTYEILCSYTQ